MLSIDKLRYIIDNKLSKYKYKIDNKYEDGKYWLEQIYDTKIIVFDNEEETIYEIPYKINDKNDVILDIEHKSLYYASNTNSNYSMLEKDNSEYKKRLAYLKQDIDRALEKKDEELFKELSKQYNIMLMEK